MKKLYAVVKNELIRYFSSPLALVYLLSFLIMNGSFAVYFGDFFNRGEADLSSMFAFQPWIYLLFVPGIAMRLWAEEFHSKTVVQIVSMPVSVTTLVWGKFFAAWIFCGLALLLTFPFWIVVNMLGQPDNAVILTGYLGSFLLAGCMLAVSEVMSALTKNQVIALVLAVISNLLFFWSGIEYVLSFCRLFMPETVVEIVASLSFLTHFNLFVHGVIGLNSLIFFASVIIFGNYTASLIVTCRTSEISGFLKTDTPAQTFAAWLALFMCFAGVNLLAYNCTDTFQYDATSEKIFTLTDDTKQILKKLPRKVTAKLYYSPVLGERNPVVRRQFEDLRLLLKKYKSAGKGNFDYKIYYPEFLSNDEDIAIADGIQPVPLIDLNRNALFGMTLEDTLQGREVIPFFAQNGMASPEYEITSKLQLMDYKRKTIGVIAGAPIFGYSDGKGFSSEPWKIIELLEQKYKTVQIKDAADFENNKFDVLFIYFPENLQRDVLEQIKKYSESGGKILLLLDPAHEASRLYLPGASQAGSSDSAELEKLWKFKFYKDYVVADLKNSITVDATINYRTNPVFSQDVIQFRLQRADMNPKHPVTQNLNEIMMASASVIMPDMQSLQDGKIIFYPLLRASGISSLMTAKVVRDGLNPAEILKYFRPDDNQKFLAAEIIGTESSNPFDLIAVADSDFLYDVFWMEKDMFLESEYTVSVFDNANFLLNSVDYLAGDYSLLGLRGKQARIRRFDGIETMRRVNSLQYKQKESEIFDRMDKAKRTVQEVWNKKNFEERDNFSPDELEIIAKVRNDLDAMRRELADLRLAAYNDVNSVSARVTFAVVWLIPLVISLLVLLRLIVRFITEKHSVKISFRMPGRGLCILLASGVLVLAAGAASVYLSGLSSIDTYENKPAFPAVMKHINDINKISLVSNNGKLTFVKKEGIWTLEEMPDLPVYQERIRHLLTVTAQATFFAGKSNRAEDLAVFNLLPPEDKNSGAVSVTFGSGNKVVQQFYLGNTGKDIGRGGKAAYIRFGDSFRVWEIRADFINVNTDIGAWTYDRVWDLRYGRLYDKYHNPENEDKLLQLMKIMLNTEFERITEKPANAPAASIKLYIEDGNSAELYFYRENGKSYVSYEFDKLNQNPDLKLIAKYLDGKAAEINNAKMEKILEIING